MAVRGLALRANITMAAFLVWSVVAMGAQDIQSGTWKMDPAKSKYSPGPPAKSVILKIESDEKGMKVDSQLVNGAGQAMHVQFEAKYDGKDYPATGLGNADHITAKRLNANTTQVIMKKDGQAVMIVTTVVSKDGKTRTSTYKGKDAQGHEINNMVVFDRQ